MAKKEVVRLHDFVHPKHYTLSIEPNKEMNSYKGSVQIKANITKPTKDIILHSKNSKIKTTTICVGTQCLLPKLTEDKDSEIIRLEVLKEISGDIEIHIEFEGVITEDLAGIYKSTYEHKGKKEHLITTQCEAPYARRIFPCFDEPDKKATFDLTVKIEKNLKAISNTLPKSERIEENKKVIEFKTSPKMSSYLFYLGIGDFEFREGSHKKIKIRIVTTPGKKSTDFALEHTKRYLQYFENYSEIPYPLEKLDMIAIPDFSAGAMENWGAITFREILLIVDKSKTSIAIQKRAAEVIAHELWHQWSGNLVTMKWWDDLWLNESFANYMAYKAVDDYKPEWKIWEDYLSNELAAGLFKDSLKTTHPIEVKVNSPEEISEIFDEISYNKGGSVLRMLEEHMSKEDFRKGVSNYLKQYAYSNAKASDLWSCLDKINTDKKVKEMMAYWISEKGYPLINIEETKEGIKVSQKRCNDNTNQIWPTPITLLTDNSTNKILLSKKEDSFKIKGEYIKANHDHFGFYRIKYSDKLLKDLILAIKNKKINDSDRWGIHNDLWALCNINQESVKNYISFIENYLDENNYTILAEIFSSVRKLDRLYYYEDWWQKSKNKLTNMLLPIYKKNLSRLGWDKKRKEDSEDTLMRGLSISFCGFAGDKETIKESNERFLKNNLNLDIAGSIYSILAQQGDEKIYLEMVKRFESIEEAEPKLKLLGGIYQFRNEEILRKALDFALTDKVRTQNLRNVFSTALINPISQKIFLKWTKDNWDKIKKHQDTHYIFQDFLDTLIISQINEVGKKEVKDFINNNKIGFELTKANGFEILDLNIKFIEKNREFLKNY